MSAKFRLFVQLLGATAVVAWSIAAGQALPRLLAGPLCSSRQDTWILAGHCPACFIAAGLTIAFGMTLILARRDATLGPARVPI